MVNKMSNPMDSGLKLLEKNSRYEVLAALFLNPKLSYSRKQIL